MFFHQQKLQYSFQAWNVHSPGKYRELLSFLLARDTLHQNQWAATVRELPNTVEKAAGTLQDKLNKE